MLDATLTRAKAELVLSGVVAHPVSVGLGLGKVGLFHGTLPRTLLVSTPCSMIVNHQNFFCGCEERPWLSVDVSFLPLLLSLGVFILKVLYARERFPLKPF